MKPLKSPLKLAGFAVTLVKIFKFETLCNFTPPCVKPPRLTVHNLGTIFVTVFRHPLLLLNSLEDHRKRHCF